MLGQKGLLIVKLAPLDGAADEPMPTGHIPLPHLSAFTRQLAMMTRAGMPLLQTLEALGRQSTVPAAKEMIENLALSVERGCMLSEAMVRHPKVFNRVYVSMVQAGE